MRTAFKIPLQTEVSKYIEEKTGWPRLFCDYYGDKFWNHYQASGWKLSSGNAIKDWKACFNSQWKRPKFKEDIEMLQSFGGKASPAKVVHMMQPNKEIQAAPITDIERLDTLLVKYAEIPTFYTIERLSAKWPDEALNHCYSIIKENRLWDPRITGNDLEGLDERRLKATVIIRTLDYYGCKGWMFSDTLKMREKLK